MRHVNNVEEGSGQQLTFRKAGKRQAGGKPRKQGTEKEQKDTYIKEALTAEPQEKPIEKDFL